MKNSIFIITAILLISVGCKETPTSYFAKEGRININEAEFIIIRLSSESGFIDSYSNLIIENCTKDELTYGAEYSIERFDKENWTKIKLDFDFTDIGYISKAGEKMENEQIYLSKKYFSKFGKYRIIKHIGIYDLCIELDVVQKKMY